jgi:hypothetical protein
MHWLNLVRSAPALGLAAGADEPLALATPPLSESLPQALAVSVNSITNPTSHLVRTRIVDLPS